MAGVTPSNVKVYLNGDRLQVKDFNSYIDMYLAANPNEEGSESVKIFERPHDFWEIGLSISDGQFQQVSYVNSICTYKGGTHVNYAVDKVVDYLLNIIKSKHKKLEVKPFQIKQHIWIFVNAMIVNPSFDSQTKEQLTLKISEFGSKFDFSDNFLKKVAKSGIIDHIVSFAKTRQDLKLTKQLNAGVKKGARLLGIPKLEDANLAGTKNSEKCTLILTEGDSAKSLAMAGIEIVGRDEFGVFPLKGKLLNAREASANNISKNDEIQNLMKIIGLQKGKIYEDVKALRYGSIMIMTDQDHDGSHIKGLIINFIHFFWPSLIKMKGFLREFITPIIKATKGSDIRSFFTIPEYKDWVLNQLGGSTKGWKIKYYKGLGTSSDKEAQEYFSAIDRHKIDFEYIGEDDDQNIDLVFNKKRADDRKTWLAEYDPEISRLESNYQEISYTDFINKEFIQFSIADNQRSIPSLCDGLKPSERKIVFSCFKRKLKDEIKVAQLAGYVSEHSAYHHGEASLYSTIIALSQNYVGSNNINLLMPIGQFGTRNQGGKDAASARYIFTNLNKVTRHMFNEYDDPLMTYIVEEGQKIEPIWYLPIIPLILVNGSDGIGTGWSSTIPCFNPREIVDNIRTKLKTGKFNEMHPWYKGYQGKIVKKEDKSGYTITGLYHWKEDDPNTLVITELPIKKWTKDYKILLDKFMGIEVAKDSKKKKKEDNEEKEEKKEKIILEDIREYHTNNRVHFEVKFLPDYVDEFKDDEDKLLKKFKLQTSMSLSNMVLFNYEGKIRRYDAVEDILDEFYALRLNFYTRRKENLLANLERDLRLLTNKARFILEVIEDTIKIKKIKRKDLIIVLHQRKYDTMTEINKIAGKKSIDEPIVIKNDDEKAEEDQESDENLPVPAKEYDYLLSMPLWSLTYERVNDILNKKEDKLKEIEILKETKEEALWENDLANFVKVLDEVEAKEEDERLQANKIKKRGTNKGAGKNKGNGNKGKAAKTNKEKESKKKLNNSFTATVKDKKGKDKDVKDKKERRSNSANKKETVKKKNEKVSEESKESSVATKKTLTEEELMKLPLNERVKYKSESK